MKTSRKELTDILIAWVVISVAFAIVINNRSFNSQFPASLGIAAFTVGIGFLIHELAHKFVAQKYGCFAEFRANIQMLIIALALSFTGFIFAAPGAVYISGAIDYRKNGKVSVAGPLANICLAAVFLILSFLLKNRLFFFGFNINLWLGLFNLIPFGNFDGSKILKWNKIVYSALVILCFFLIFLANVF